MKRTLFAALLLCLLLSACGGETVPPAPEEENPPSAAPEAPPEPEPTLEELEEAALRALMESMGLEKKVGQLFFVKVPLENALEDVATYHLGGYLLFGKDTRDKTANELIQNIASWQTQAVEYLSLIHI